MDCCPLGARNHINKDVHLTAQWWRPKVMQALLISEAVWHCGVIASFYRQAQLGWSYTNVRPWKQWLYAANPPQSMQCLPPSWPKGILYKAQSAFLLNFISNLSFCLTDPPSVQCRNQCHFQSSTPETKFVGSSFPELEPISCRFTCLGYGVSCFV
jgi:hypothetical protein